MPDKNTSYSEGKYARPGSWANFCYLAKHQIRYLFPAYIDKLDTNSHKALDILKEVAKMMKRYGLVSTILAGTKVSRCRQHKKEELIINKNQIYNPEIKYCENPNRMSPAGISISCVQLIYSFKTHFGEEMERLKNNYRRILV